MSTQTRAVYRGRRRKLVLAFDLGTTYSGISYSVLEPSESPEIKGVTRFPAHDLISGPSKIPTVIYYDQSGKIGAAGAGVMKEGIYKVAEAQNWVRTEWFKVHLTPKAVGDLPALPLNKTVVEVFADFFKYLLECASSHIQDTHAGGPDLWESVKSHIDFVLSYPNGWGGTQKSELRRAAVLAGLVPDNPSGHSRLLFVTEGEASLHFSVQNGLLAGEENGDGIIVADAGSGTINISSYGRNTDSSKGSFEEIGPSQCHFYGLVSVSYHARQSLANYLSDSPYLKYLEHIVDETIKVPFKNVEEPHYIKFGLATDNDDSHNIRGGQLKLMGSDIAQFFQPSVKCIVNTVLERKKTAHITISHVVLVGEFAASSDWLYAGVHDMLTPHGLKIICPENHVNKAVSVRSDGTMSFYLDRINDPWLPRTDYSPSCMEQPPNRAITATDPVVTQQLPSQSTTNPPLRHDLQPESPTPVATKQGLSVPVSRPPWGGLQQESRTPVTAKQRISPPTGRPWLGLQREAMIELADYDREYLNTPPVITEQSSSSPFTHHRSLGSRSESVVSLGDYDREHPGTPSVTSKQRIPPSSTSRPWLGLQQKSMIELADYDREYLNTPPVITEQSSSSPFTHHRSLGSRSESVVSLGDYDRERPGIPSVTAKQRIPPSSTSRRWLGLQQESMIELADYDREYLNTPPVITEQSSSSHHRSLGSRSESVVSLGDYDRERPGIPSVTAKQRIPPSSTSRPWLGSQQESMIELADYNHERLPVYSPVTTNQGILPSPPHSRRESTASLGSFNFERPDTHTNNKQRVLPPSAHLFDSRRGSMMSESSGHYDRERPCAPPIIITKKERIPPPSIHIHHHDTRSGLSNDLEATSDFPIENHGNIINPPPASSEDNFELLIQENHRMKKELKQVYGDLENCEHELRRSRADIRDAHHHIDDLENALNDKYQQLADTKSLSSGVSLMTPPTLLGLEVGEKVTALNEEIFQAAAALGESLTRERMILPRSYSDAATAESREIFGLEITKLLITQSQNLAVDHLLVQVILQIFMVKFCVSKILSWHPGSTGVTQFLTATYSKMCLTEEQTVSAKWRALTCAYTRPSTRPSTETWTKECFKKLVSVLKVAAWTGSRNTYDSFTNRLPSIFKAVQELRAAMEAIASANLDVSVFDYDTPFDPLLMIDVYDDGIQPPAAHEAIIGTTGMGLKKHMENSKGAQQFQTVVPANIVLLSSLKQASEVESEPQPIPTWRPVKLKKKTGG